MKKISRATLIPPTFSILSIVFSLVVGAIILKIIGKDPILYFTQLFIQGICSPLGFTESIIRMTPYLIQAAGYIVCFGAGQWNIGGDGQFLIGAMLAGWAAPTLAANFSFPVYFIMLAFLGILGGMAWVLLPAMLKAWYDINEIITTMMMGWVAINLVTWLVKGPINDPSTVPPQTKLIPMSYRMPMIPLTRVHIGVIIGIISVIGVHWMMRRTALGYQFRTLLANKKVAFHAGMNVTRTIMLSILISGGFAGLSGVIDVLSTKGLFQAGWTPEYGWIAVCIVFVSRMNGWAVIPLAFYFSFLGIGGEFVARDLGVPTFFVQVLVGLTLLFVVLYEYLEGRIANE